MILIDFIDQLIIKEYWTNCVYIVNQHLLIIIPHNQSRIISFRLFFTFY